MKNRQHIKWGFLFFFLPVVLWLFLLIVLPHLELLRLSFSKANTGKFTLDNYLAFFQGAHLLAHLCTYCRIFDYCYLPGNGHFPPSLILYLEDSERANDRCTDDSHPGPFLGQ